MKKITKLMNIGKQAKTLGKDARVPKKMNKTKQKKKKKITTDLKFVSTFNGADSDGFFFGRNVKEWSFFEAWCRGRR